MVPAIHVMRAIRTMVTTTARVRVKMGVVRRDLTRKPLLDFSSAGIMLFSSMNGSTEAEVKPRQANTFGSTLLRPNVFAPLRVRLPNQILVDTRETLGKVGECIWSGREDLNLRHPVPKGNHIFLCLQYDFRPYHRITKTERASRCFLLVLGLLPNSKTLSLANY